MISMDRQYRTRDGREVRIYAVDGCGPYPVHGAVAASDGWNFQTWAGEADRDGDLVEVKQTITRVVHLAWIKNHSGAIAINNPVAANKFTWPDAIAITGPHEITFTEGDGL